MERGWIDYKRQNISAILLQRFSWNLAMVCLKLIHACSRSLTKIYQQNFLLDTIFQEGWSMKMLITLKIFFISLIKYNYTTTEWQEKVFPKFYCHHAKAGKVMTQSLTMTISLGLGATLIPNRTRKTVWWLKSSPGVPKYIFFYRQEARIWPTSFPGSLSHRRRKERTLGTRLDQLIMQQSESGSFKNICEYNPE